MYSKELLRTIKRANSVFNELYAKRDMVVVTEKLHPRYEVNITNIQGLPIHKIHEIMKYSVSKVNKHPHIYFKGDVLPKPLPYTEEQYFTFKREEFNVSELVDDMFGSVYYVNGKYYSKINDTRKLLAPDGKEYEYSEIEKDGPRGYTIEYDEPFIKTIKKKKDGIWEVGIELLVGVYSEPGTYYLDDVGSISFKIRLKEKEK